MFAGVFNKWRSGCKKIKPIRVSPIETTIPMTKELATDFFKQFGGEGELELRERMNKTLTEIMNKNDHQVVLAVSHGAACAQFYRAWEEHAKVKKTERFYNCCIQKYEYENGIFTLVEIFNRNITE